MKSVFTGRSDGLGFRGDYDSRPFKRGDSTQVLIGAVGVELEECIVIVSAEID